MTLYFITGNSNKFLEAKLIIPDLVQLKIDLPEIQSMDQQEIIRAKLEEAKKHCSEKELFCEDVSLSISAFNGFHGSLVKYWVASGSCEELVKRVHAFDNHKAKAICTIGYTDGQEMYFFEGSVKGKIVRPRVKSDFGFDPIFEVEDSDKTFAEMTPEEKKLNSHRGAALSKLKELLNQKK